MDKLKFIGLLVGMAFIAMLFLVVAIYVEDPLLNSRVTTGPGMLLDEWQRQFRFWASVGIAAALAAAMLWCSVCQWSAGAKKWEWTSGRRVIWLLLMLVPLGAFAAAWLLTPAVQGGELLATAFYLFNNVAVYYFATACFSPSCVKYTPIGAIALRHW